MAAKAVIVNDANGPVANAEVSLGGYGTPFPLTKGDGYAIYPIGLGSGATYIKVFANGYKPYLQTISLDDANQEIYIGGDPNFGPPNTIHLPSLSFNQTRDQLLLFRGSLNIKCNESVRITLKGTVSTNGIWHQTDEDAAYIIQQYKKRNYTHGPIGPFIDAGYHGLTPPTDFRDDRQREKIERSIQNLHANNIITPIFLTPDGWTVEQLRTIEPIFKSDVWQKLGSIVVNGFEQQGSRYGWSNYMYVEYLSWMKEVFPNAVRGLHTASTIEAPVGRGDDTSKPGMSLNECWGRLSPLIDYWLTQFDMWDYAWSHVDPNNPDGRTDLEHWYDLWDKTKKSSFINRFSADGTWPLAKNIIPIPGEFWSYGLVWNNLSEGTGMAIGRHAIELGAHGSFDGC